MAKLGEEMQAAALHLLLGLKAPEDIPPGHYDLSRIEITARFPEFAAVDRAGGDEKDEKGNLLGLGFDVKPAPDLSLSLGMILLALKKTGAALTKEAWAECVREGLKESAAKPDVPPEALDALKIVQAEQPAAKPVKAATQKKRTGTKEIILTMKRLPKTAPKKVKKP